jgi:hypothetical protein
VSGDPVAGNGRELRREVVARGGSDEANAASRGERDGEREGGVRGRQEAVWKGADATWERAVKKTFAFVRDGGDFFSTRRHRVKENA